jgi:hypothetical protein
MIQDFNDYHIATNKEYMKEADRSKRIMEILLLLNLIAWPLIAFMIYILG